MLTRFSLYSMVLALLSNPSVRAADASDKEISKILNTHCHRCHGQNGSIEGGMNYITDLNRLLQKRLIVAGKTEESPLLKRMVKGEMPPGDEVPRPSPAEIEKLRKWIAEGAKLENSSAAAPWIAPLQELQWIQDDLLKIESRSRKFQRYISFTAISNAGANEDELKTYQNALSKLINSLSWHPEIRIPQKVDARGTLYRIDLRWYLWDAVLWNRILQDYPYGIQTDSFLERVIASLSSSRLPVIRGDWLIATASRPQLYQDILRLPAALPELERQLRVESEIDIQQDRVIRVAFNGSGISKNNRILERHVGSTGYYWRTYDFEEVPQNLVDRGNLLPDRRNVFAYPLGPGNLVEQFQHAGGEAIFRLPNGLQAYFIMNAVNNRLDKAPVAIVSDPKRPDRAVELGISCMGCHITGILPKADQMHDHLLKNAQAFKKGDLETALSLYPDKERSLKQMEQDSQQFQKALAMTGTPKSKNEPIIALTQRYEGDLTAIQAAAELGLPFEEMQKRLANLHDLNRNVGALRVSGGVIPRQVWLQAFPDLVTGLQVGHIFQANRDSGRLPDNTGDVDPLENISGTANAMVFTGDGRTAFLASGDKTIRVMDVEGQRDGKRFIGHSAAVWAIDLSANEEWLVSGSADRSVRVWERKIFEEKIRFEGHDSTVTQVKFGPSGTIFSAGMDGKLLAWERKNPKEYFRKWDFGRPISFFALDSAGDKLAVGFDSKVQILDIGTQKILSELLPGGGTIRGIIFLKDQELVLAGEKGTVQRWNFVSKNKLNEWQTGHGILTFLAVSADKKRFLTAGSDNKISVWNFGNAKPHKTFGPLPQSVAGIFCTSSNKQIIAGTKEAGFKFWKND